MNVKCGIVTGLLATRIPTPDNTAPAGDRTARDDPRRRRAGRAPNSADQRRDAGARRQRVDRAGMGGTPPEASAPDRRSRTTQRQRPSRQWPRTRRTGTDRVAVDDLLPLIRKTFDIEFSPESQEWFEQVMVPWAASTGATHTTSENRISLTERTKHALYPLMNTEQKGLSSNECGVGVRRSAGLRESWPRSPGARPAGRSRDRRRRRWDRAGAGVAAGWPACHRATALRATHRPSRCSDSSYGLAARAPSGVSLEQVNG